MTSVNDQDPRCPECGEPIGLTATYCMHCSADLTGEREPSTGDDAYQSETSQTTTESYDPSEVRVPADSSTSLLDPDGLLDTLLTGVVGIIGGLLIGFLGTIVLTGLVMASVGVVAGFLLWIGATYYLLTCGTVQEAISKAAYGVAIGVLSIPLIVFGWAWDTNTLLFDFVLFLLVCAFLAIIPAAIGFLAGRFVPESSPNGG